MTFEPLLEVLTEHCEMIMSLDDKQLEETSSKLLSIHGIVKAIICSAAGFKAVS